MAERSWRESFGSAITDGSAVFWTAIGLALGLLIAVIAVPRHQGTLVAGGGGSGELAAGAGSGAAGSNASGASGGTGAIAASGGIGGAPTAGGGGTGTGALAPSGTVGASEGPAGSNATTPSGAPHAGTNPGAALPSAPGVSATAIRIGIAYPDISALKALGPAYDNGNVPAQWSALIQGYRQQHVLPVNGRDVQLYFASYNVLDVNQQNAACRSLVEDDHVFAVIGVEYFETGDDCVARQLHTLLITNDGPSDALEASGSPYMFSLMPPTTTILRAWVKWAAQTHRLDGARVGVYYTTSDPISVSDAQQGVLATLQKVGHPAVATATTNDTLGGPEDATAVQKFQAARVTVALLLTSIGGFLQQADAQGYHPKYLSSDYLFGTSDTSTSNYQADQWNGTYANAFTTEGASAGAKPLGPGTDSCVQNYNRQTGSNVQNPGPNGHETAEWGYIITGCDEGQMLLTALQRVGRALSVSNFIQAMHSIANVPLRRIGAVNYTGRQWGATEQRTLLWQSNCTCYRAITDWAPAGSP